MADNNTDERDEHQKCFVNKITVLQEGYGFIDNENNYRATGSITLVRTKRYVILVDTGSPRDKNKLLDSLYKLGVDLNDIDYVVCTHGHVDHVGNLNIFPKAVHIVGYDICSKDDIYVENNLKNGDHFVLEADTVEIVPTPGHTGEDVTVIVYNTTRGTVAVAGDLFECEDDEESWRDISQCVTLQETNREKIRKMADWIVPGHGAMFKVKDE